MIQVLEKQTDEQEAVFFDPADTRLSVQEAIDALVLDGESPRQAEAIVKYARGIWQRRTTYTRIIDGQEHIFTIN